MNKNTLITALVIFFISMPVSTGCSGLSDTDYIYRQALDTICGMKTESIYKTNIDSGRIIELVKKIKNNNYKNVHSLLIAKNGKLIVEEYFHGFSRGKMHEIRSARKSIGSILTGIAIDKGFIENVDEKIYKYFKNYPITTHWSLKAKNVSIKSLLTMTSGYKCDDHSVPAFQCETEMYQSNDWVEYALNLPMAHEPLEHFAYNSSSLMLVSDIISKTSKMTIPDFADNYLFSPLGITDFTWGFSPKNRVFIAENAGMLPIDMMKTGLLMLNKGKWNNIQVVSEKWVEESTENQLENHINETYGYLWWTGSQLFSSRIINGYWAAGNGGNYIFICPDLDLAAVFTGGNYSSILEIQPLGMLVNYIIPACLPPAPPLVETNLDPDLPDAYTGQYRETAGRFLMTISKTDNGLLLNIFGRDFKLHPLKKDFFLIKDNVLGDWTFKIIRNKKNKVTAGIGYAAFQKIPFKKL